MSVWQRAVICLAAVCVWLLWWEVWFVPRISSTLVVKWSRQTWVWGGSDFGIPTVFIWLEELSLSRRIFIGSYLLPSPYGRLIRSNPVLHIDIFMVHRIKESILIYITKKNNTNTGTHVIKEQLTNRWSSSMLAPFAYARAAPAKCTDHYSLFTTGIP
jgi:hypothetical protein